MQISQLNTNPAPTFPSEAGVQRQVQSEQASISSAPVDLPLKSTKQAPDRVDPGSLSKAMDLINQTIKTQASSLSFMVDEDTGIDVVKVMDMDTNEVIRQFPSKEVLAIAKALDQLQGLLVKDKA